MTSRTRRHSKLTGETFHVGSVHIHLVTLGPDTPRLAVSYVRSYRRSDDPILEIVRALPASKLKTLEKQLLDVIRWIRTPSAEDFLTDNPDA